MPHRSPRSDSLAPFFTPNGVAVIGASRDGNKVSHGVMRNLIGSGYGGPIYPVNPKMDEILGLRCYPDIASVPDPVELAVLVIPAATMPEAVAACGRRGIKAVVVISGGFREVGPEGAALEQQMVSIGREYGVRIMGPNCVGVVDTYTPLNTTFVPGMPARGHIAFISQSGALCGSVIDWTIGHHIGFSRLLSVGNEADINETDLLPFLAADGNSRVIALYLEDILGGPAFLAALREATAAKPVLALKTGRTASGQLATASHTGALAGAHAAFRAACQQTGVIEVDRIQTLFNGAVALAYQPAPAGNRIAIVTNAGGPAAVAADVLEASGLRLARTSPETQAVLRGFLHADAQVSGPVDMLGGADETHFRRAVAAVLADPTVDGVLAILVPQILSRPVTIVEALHAAQQSQPGKPLLACLMGKATVEAAHAAAHAVEIPPYTFPEDAVEAFSILWRRARWQIANSKSANQQVGKSVSGGAGEWESEGEAVRQAKARRETQTAIRLARAEGRRELDAVAARPLLQAYGIPTPEEFLAASPQEAADCAARLGFPVVMKLISPDILHKTEVGGVILNVGGREAAVAAFQTLVERGRAARPDAYIRGVQIQRMITGGQEVIVGVKRDPTFGPLVMFGLGGIYVEVLADVSFRLVPLTAADAEEMIGEVRSAKLLAGVRGAASADRAALIDAIIRIGQLAADHPEIAELDVNPLVVLPEGEGVVAVDARIILG